MFRSKLPVACLFGTVVLGAFSTANACGPIDPRILAADVLSENKQVVDEAVRELREAGPQGLAALFTVHHDLIAARVADAKRATDPNWIRLSAALDAVGAQRDCFASRLYWHTDLSTAIAAARREKKPILNLKLLGKLTDEYSCANSRFFRTSLYANEEIGNYLRKNFVLCWHSVRPVPRVTIDFGDGRKLEQTLTGNSIHYVLDSEGRPFDALPGLYGPQAFLRELRRIETGIQQATDLDDNARSAFFVQFHRQHVQAIEAAWQRDLANLNVRVAAPHPAATLRAVTAAAQKPGNPAAVVAGERALSKGIGELPILNALAVNSADRLRQATTNDVWLRLGALHANDAVLDAASVALIREQNRTAVVTGEQGGDAVSSEDALAGLVLNFQSGMAIDTVRNEYELHRILSEWFAAKGIWDLERLNERVYADLFLTPRSDPWLGLVNPYTYTGLTNGGRRE